MPTFTVINEFSNYHRFRIRPDDIKLQNDSVMGGGFGKAEIEKSAGKLVRFFQSRGYWGPFTFDQLQRYYREKGWNVGNAFFGLTGLWYDDTMLGSEWKESWPCIAIDAAGLHYVTDQFILRCAGESSKEVPPPADRLAYWETH